jgi:hypothetical protein
MTAPTRRAALTALASAPVLAIPAVAIAAVAPPDADAELIALAAQVERLCAAGEEIYARGFDPFEETFQSLMDEARAAHLRGDTSGFKERWDKAEAYSRESGRDAAIGEREDVDDQMDRLWNKMMAIPAATPAGRAAKVRALLAHVCPEWRGPAEDLDDWQIEQVRALLGQFAGMSEKELARPVSAGRGA